MSQTKTTRPADTAAAAEADKTAASAQTPARAAVEQPGPGVPATAGTDPAAAAAAEAVRKAEIERLTKERDELREKLGEAPDLVMLRAEVEALRQVAARSGISLGRQRMSAGVASDLEQTGVAVDPANGDVYVRNGEQVTVTKRGSGETSTVDMPRESTAPARSE